MAACTRYRAEHGHARCVARRCRTDIFILTWQGGDTFGLCMYMIRNGSLSLHSIGARLHYWYIGRLERGGIIMWMHTLFLGRDETLEEKWTIISTSCEGAPCPHSRPALRVHCSRHNKPRSLKKGVTSVRQQGLSRRGHINTHRKPASGAIEKAIQSRSLYTHIHAQLETPHSSNNSAVLLYCPS